MSSRTYRILHSSFFTSRKGLFISEGIDYRMIIEGLGNTIKTARKHKRNVFIKPDEQSGACSSYAVARKRRMESNVFIKPDEQSRACSSYAVARKRRMESNGYSKHLFLLLFTLYSVFFILPAYCQQKGKATFYSKRSTGARASDGSRIHHDSLTCAHRTHPFGTLLKVTNMKNGKSVIVRVTDRGPYSRGRVIDLSYRAAHEIGMLASGVAMVEIEVLKNRPSPLKPESKPYEPIEFDIVDTRHDANPLHPDWEPIKRTPKTTKPAHTAQEAHTEHHSHHDYQDHHAKSAHPDSTAHKKHPHAAKHAK